MITIFDETVYVDYHSLAEYYVFKNRAFYHYGWVGGIPKEVDLNYIKKVVNKNDINSKYYNYNRRNLYRNILCAATSEYAPEFKGWEGEASLEEQFNEIVRFAEYLGYKKVDRLKNSVHFVKNEKISKPYQFGKHKRYRNQHNRFSIDRYYNKTSFISLEDLVMLYNTPHWQWDSIFKGDYKNLKNKVRQFESAFFRIHIKRKKKKGFIVSDTKVVLKHGRF